MIIDRRYNPKGKNYGNRQRFLRRVRDRIKKKIDQSIRDKKLGDIGIDEEVKVPIDDISEPTFEKDFRTGSKERVIPGNSIFEEGTEIDKPSGGGGAGGRGGKASNTGEGEDDFVFTLSYDEFLDFFFDDLELPDMIKRSIKDTSVMKPKRAGYKKTGSPANLSVERTYRQSLGRRIALARPSEEEIKELEEKIKNEECEETRKKLIEELEYKKKRLKIIPFFDDTDLRYRNFVVHPVPNTSAVMFCIMDVSASMGEEKKNYSKRFFLLLYTFLKKKYDKVDIVFIRYHTDAEEVDEEEFFVKTDTGGTVTSKGLELAKKIIEERYPPSEWNIYIAHASDGDNYADDNSKVIDLVEELLDIAQYYAYIQVNPSSTVDWSAYLGSENLASVFKKLKENENRRNLQIKYVRKQNEIWEVFRELFKKR